MNKQYPYVKTLKTLCFLIVLCTQMSYAFKSSEPIATKSNLKKAPSANTISCSTVACILNAMLNASPGDEIIIAEGTYTTSEKLDLNMDGKASRFSSTSNGTASQPIILRGASATNRPILKGPDGIFDGYIMRILGDYWIIKDIELKEGSKGLVLDNASYCSIENVSVHDIGEEGIHLRDGSSNNLVTGCQVYNTGRNKPGFGEGLYVGSDKGQHKTAAQPDEPYNPDCNNNTIEFCTVGPNVAAEGVDVKEGTKNTIIRNNTFSADGIAGEDSNSADAFIDLKGSYAFVYNNTFNLDGSTLINSGIDFLDRGTGYNTGYRNAVFGNTFNLGDRGSSINTVRKKQGNPSEIHVWNNKRNPATEDFPVSDGTEGYITQSCPSWNIVPCSGGSSNQSPSASITSPINNSQIAEGSTLQISVSANDLDGTVRIVEFYNGTTKLGEDNSEPYTHTIANIVAGSYTLSAQAIDNEDAITVSSLVQLTVSNGDVGGDATCGFGTPQPIALPQFDGITFNNVYVLGSGGPDQENIKKLKIKWIPSANGLYVFSLNTNNGQPSSYIDLRDKITENFNSTQPSVSIVGSGLTALDGAYWVAEHNGNFVMTSKAGNYTIYCSNSSTAPVCATALQTKVSLAENETQEIILYPNPIVNGEVTLMNLKSEKSVLSLINMQGVTVKKEHVNNKDNTLIFNVSGVPQGLYFIRVENGAVVKTIPVTIN